MKALTKKQRNEIYWKAYERIGISRFDIFISGFLIDEMIDRDLDGYVSELFPEYIFVCTGANGRETKGFRLTALGFMIAMTEN